jgi:lipoate-protein ligase A
MTAPTVRLLPLETLSGPANMAADEALLHSATGGVASLRFYTWAEPTLSLGYFQPAAARLSDPRLTGLPWVRRASGGAALVHHHELTYALALPPGRTWQDPAGGPWACRFHYIVIRALARFGAKSKSVVCGEERKLGDVLCFLDQTPGDLVADGAKVVGSAQRKQKGALVQHGGILLRQSEFTPSLPGLRETTGVEVSAGRVAEAVAEEFTADTGWRLEPGSWTADELALRATIEAERYGNPAWNEKR